ncbi:hypothetical protein GCM10007304_32300 [Rhodococcoides trifolii]|uniref:Uncharacterized protein n=1 Tax=Rhodococcoides trifolii TaxID=908250 RepID=A0A917G0D6_9NOCA|nr:hypothetical protein [Rhodococcus trifolii]GGG15740.1 hypothetical protein GCM10007304_32300 [Rhodococcus trifolii]
MVDVFQPPTPEAVRPGVVHRLRFGTRPTRVSEPWTGPCFAVDDSAGALVAATPSAAPDLWSRYVDGAVRTYERHGVSIAIDMDELASGATTTLFFVALDHDGRMLGGLRAQGPYTHVEQSHALVEWEHSDGLELVQNEIRARLPHGVVEMKTAWVDDDAPSKVVSSQLARVALPTMNITGARFLLATAADHVLRQWQSSGGRISESIPPAAYPTDKYRTRLMWWDHDTVAEDARPDVWDKMLAESADMQISRRVA